MNDTVPVGAAREAGAERRTALLSVLTSLRVATWLDRRRVRAAAIVLLAMQLALFLFFVAGTHGWIVPVSGPTPSDFVGFYAAGSLANAGTPALAYNTAAHAAAEAAAVGPGLGLLPFNYPPTSLLLFAPIAHLPYLASFLLFEAVTLALYLFVARRILDDRSGTALLALLAYPIVFWVLGFGQNSFLTAAVFGAATLLVDRRPIVAGLLFGAMCYKPQFGLLVPFALAAAGRWSAFAAAALSAVALVIASVALFGLDTWQAFLRTPAEWQVFNAAGLVPYFTSMTAFGAVRLWGGGMSLAYAVQTLVTVALVALVVVVWYRSRSLPTRAAMLAAAAPIAVPMALHHDLMMSAIAGLWLVRDRSSAFGAQWEMAALGGLYLLLLYGRQLEEQWHVPVFLFAAIAVLAIAGARAWREARPDVRRYATPIGGAVG